MAAPDAEATYDAIDVVLPGAVLRDARRRPQGFGQPFDVRVRGRRLRAVYRTSSLWVPAWQLQARLEPVGGGVRVVGRFRQPWTWALVAILAVPAVLMLALAGVGLLGGDESVAGLGLVGLALAGMSWFVWPARRPCSDLEHDRLVDLLTRTLSADGLSGAGGEDPCTS